MGAETRLNEIVEDARAWRADTVGAADAWTVGLSDACLDELAAFAHGRQHGGDPTGLRLSGAELPACRAALGPAHDHLTSGRGFAVIDRIPMGRFDSDEARTFYWLLGQLLGEPFEQDVAGTLLFDVRDTGQSVTDGARFSRTSAASSFHTDGAFNPQTPDMVALLCLQVARSGGESQLINAYALHNEMLEHHPEALATLYRPFLFDRRGEFAPGERPVTETPLFGWDGRELRLRYLHYYIRVGHERADRPLDAGQLRALELVEALLERDDLMATFRLEPGQMLFANNWWILHNRTAFEDFDEVERRRHYVRLWLGRRG
jgi:alpha-ketoglutarate-dependent taurine dioxygenase